MYIINPLGITFFFFFCVVQTIETAEHKHKPFPTMQSTIYCLKVDGVSCLVITPRVHLNELEITFSPNTNASDSVFLTVIGRTTAIRKDDSKESPEILHIPLKQTLRTPHETHEIEITATRDPNNASLILLLVSGHK